MELKSAVPWGRDLNEYIKMFLLSKDDLTKKILGCSDGPASFNSELTTLGGDVTSVDPIYNFSKNDISSRIGEVYDEIMPQMLKHRDDFNWDTIASVEELGKIRMGAMQTFLDDYIEGIKEKRYIAGELPKLPFKNNQFDITLCSHFLFLYSEQLSLEFHIKSILELIRVSKEVRIYPLITLKNETSPHLTGVLDTIKDKMSIRKVSVPYRFQKGADKMLIISKFTQ